MNKILLISSYKGPLQSRLVNTAWDAGWTIAVAAENLSGACISSIRNHFDGMMAEATEAGIQTIPDVSRSRSDLKTIDQWLEEQYRLIMQEPHLWPEDECALVLFTSGSTGVPKGVCHSRGNIRRSAQLFVDHFELTEHDLLVCLAPPHTMSGFRSLLLPSVRVRHVCEATGFLSLVQQISTMQATLVLCGPVFIRQLAAWADRLPSQLQGLRGLLCTGADLDPEDRSRVEQILGIPVLDYYGLTETAGLVLGDTFSRRSPGCLPAPCRGVELLLQPTEQGDGVFELAVFSPNLFLGYLGNRLARQSIFNTGDLVRTDGSHCLKLLGRHSGAVKAPSTEWLYPQRLETWLREHLKQVSDVVVKAIPVPGGQGLELWIDSTEALDTVRLEEQIITQLGKDYRPVRWHFSRIERTPLGKLSSAL
jgi:acyl-CoA synthetase (AMP-forming)/AMP-acid ligase II